jgi:hypothetical protein
VLALGSLGPAAQIPQGAFTGAIPPDEFAARRARVRAVSGNGLLSPRTRSWSGRNPDYPLARRAWEAGARRVWLHTASLDHPNALANYLARGFRVYDTEER